MGMEKQGASDRNTYRSFHDRCALCAYGTTSTVRLTTIAFIRFPERNIPTIGSVFDIRAFDDIPVPCEQCATHPELGIWTIGLPLCCSPSVRVNKPTTTHNGRCRPCFDEHEPWIAASMIFLRSSGDNLCAGCALIASGWPLCSASAAEETKK